MSRGEERTPATGCCSQKCSRKSPQIGTSGHRPLRCLSQLPAAQVLQLQAGSSSRGGRCSGPEVVNATPICHSSYWVEYCNKKGQSPPSSGDSTNMAEPALLLETMSDLPLIVPQTPHLLMNPEGEPNPLIQQVHLHLAAWRVSGQASPREAFLRQLISASWRPGTEKAYNSVWKQWRSWCEGRSTSVFSASVVEFIAQKQYSTLNLYRSALSATIPPKEGHPVGQRPLVCRALQGSFSQRPPMPKYTSTWDVNTVVLYLKEKMGDTPTLNLKALSQYYWPCRMHQTWWLWMSDLSSLRRKESPSESQVLRRRGDQVPRGHSRCQGSRTRVSAP